MAIETPLVRRVMRNLALFLAISLSACAPIALLPFDADAPLAVSVPIASAGVRDVRASFAQQFADELAADARSGATAHAESSTAGWLHGVGTAERGNRAAVAARAERFAARRAGTVVLVVPGLFGDCVGEQSVPFGDGVVRTLETEAVAAYAQYADLGLRAVRAIPLPGRASSVRNGRLVAAAIRAAATDPALERLVLVAYSKGLPDTLHALEILASEGGMPTQLSAVVSVAGVVMGSPLADRFAPLYDTLSPLVEVFHCSTSEGGELGSVSRRERTAWLDAHPLRDGIAYYSIVAYAVHNEIAPGLRSGHRLLAAIDPRNDGQLIASDAILPGSELLAAARSDHWDVALPRDRHPNPLLRGLTSARAYPREALFRATLKWVVGAPP